LNTVFDRKKTLLQRATKLILMHICLARYYRLLQWRE